MTNEQQTYQLPQLPYQLSALQPFLSEKLLTLHYQKHHQAYVDNANKLLGKLEQARKTNEELNYRDTYQSLTFNVGGLLLHNLYWNSLAPKKDTLPQGELKDLLEKEYGTIERFKQEFTQTALTIEGSGWAVLAYSDQTKRPLIMQVKDHNLYVYPSTRLLMALDMWEHAYYLDYLNDKKRYVEAFWSFVNWECL